MQPASWYMTPTDATENSKLMTQINNEQQTSMTMAHTDSVKWKWDYKTRSKGLNEQRMLSPPALNDISTLFTWNNTQETTQKDV